LAFSDPGRSLIPRIEESLQAVVNRGPDHQAVRSFKDAALGHARLAIIDLSAEANQPFSDPTGRYHIVLNGEIFNYREIREELKKSGSAFLTKSDTEVLLELFIRKGAAAIHQLNGFFAFAIYDSTEEVLFLGRDRFGIKPLLYYHDNDTFIFSSRMDGITAFGLKLNLDIVSTRQYFCLNYLPQPQSIYTEVKKIPPGHFAFVKNGDFKLTAYWAPNPKQTTQEIPTFSAATKQIRELLSDAVERRLIADVPTGAFLSGGLDSSIIVALASHFKPGIETFTIGFSDEPRFDERPVAAAVAKKYNTNHHEISLTTDDLYAVLFDMLDELDEPFADSSALAVYILSREVKKHVTVALSGDGADEVFGGYIKHSAEWMAGRYRWMLPSIQLLSPLLKRLPQSRQGTVSNFFRQLIRFTEGLKLPEAERYWQWCSIRSEKEVDLLINVPYNQIEYQQRKQDILHHFGASHNLNATLVSDQELVLSGDMLQKVDSMSMAHALEVRVPFLDFRLVEFANTLPSTYKIRGSERKRILRESFRHLLPEEVLSHRKHGFEVPLLKWFRGDLSGLIHKDLLEPGFIKEQGLFRESSIAKLRYQLLSGSPGDAPAKIWALLVFQYWWKKKFKSQIHYKNQSESLNS
jgi:asparagine synthase (glutamine-hydrolysing)